MNDDVRLMLGDCLERMGEIETASVDAIICDPPYPEIDRPYGRMTEEAWHAMMRGVVAESRRILKPSGSALFILQPNSEKVGRMRPWLFEFQAWTSREWNMVQDFSWWNITAPPTVHCQRINGLARPSLKACVWLGDPDCYRDQDSVLWVESDGNKAKRLSVRCENNLEHRPSGYTWRDERSRSLAFDRGGTTPFNLLPIAGHTEGHGHPGATPADLCDWWVRYISPDGGLVCDPFMGSGTVGLAALKRGRRFVGIERDAGYFTTAERRLAEHLASTPLLSSTA